VHRHIIDVKHSMACADKVELSVLNKFEVDDIKTVHDVRPTSHRENGLKSKFRFRIIKYTIAATI